MPRQIDYYFSLSSPSAYIGHQAFRDVVIRMGDRLVFREAAPASLGDALVRPRHADGGRDSWGCVRARCPARGCRR